MRLLFVLLVPHIPAVGDKVILIFYRVSHTSNNTHLKATAIIHKTLHILHSFLIPHQIATTVHLEHILNNHDPIHILRVLIPITVIEDTVSAEIAKAMKPNWAFSVPARVALSGISYSAQEWVRWVEQLLAL